MKPLLHHTSLPSFKTDISAYKAAVASTGTLPDGDVPLEAKMWYVLQLVEQNRTADAALLLDTINYNPNALTPPIYTAWMWLVRMSIYIARADYLMAGDAAERTLRALDAIVVKKGDDFLAILAGVLYNLAMLHNASSENSRAAKELAKAQKLYERLVKKDESQFATMLTYAVEASMLIFKSRQQQMEVFAHYHDLTEQYSGMVEGGNRDSIAQLVDSLHKEGEIMLEMGNHRDAMKYFTKALRYQKRISSEMGMKELTLSIGLARSLMRIANRRESADQLLASLQPLAQRLGATEAQAEIASLLDKKDKNNRIMTLLKGIF